MGENVDDRKRGGILGSAAQQTPDPGFVFVVGMDAAAFEVREICRIDIPAEQARPWTVVLGDLGFRTLPAPVLGPFSLVISDLSPTPIGSTYCKITFGTDGVNQSVFLDWRLGQVVTVWGSFVLVEVGFDKFILGAGALQFAKASITEGMAIGHVAPTFSTFISAVGPNFGVVSPVQGLPPFARRFTHSYDIVGNTLGANNSRVVEFFVEFAAVFFRFARFEYGNVVGRADYPSMSPIPALATHWAYRNLSLLDQFSVVLQFELGL